MSAPVSKRRLRPLTEVSLMWIVGQALFVLGLAAAASYFTPNDRWASGAPALLGLGALLWALGALEARLIEIRRALDRREP